MASLFPRKTYNKDGVPVKIWYIKYTVGKKVKHKSTGCKNKADANTFFREFNPSNAVNKKITLSSLESIAYKYAENNNGANMQYQYKITWKAFIEYMKDIPLANVFEEDINDFLKHRKKTISKYGRPLSNRTVNLDLFVLKKSFKLATSSKRRWLNINPAAEIKRLPVDRTVPDYKKSDIDILLNSLSNMKGDKAHDKYLATLIAFNCGLRRGEVCGLKWPVIDFSDGTIELYNKIDGKPEKVYFNSVVRDALILLRDRKILDMDGYIWGYKMSAGSLYYRIKEHIKKNGLNPKLTFHSTRHTFITIAVNGHGIHAGQKMARHRDIKQTEKYYHAEDEQIKKFAESIIII